MDFDRQSWQKRVDIFQSKKYMAKFDNMLMIQFILKFKHLQNVNVNTKY